MMPRSTNITTPPIAPPAIAPTGVDDLLTADSRGVDAGMDDEAGVAVTKDKLVVTEGGAGGKLTVTGGGGVGVGTGDELVVVEDEVVDDDVVDAGTEDGVGESNLDER